jgi:hypothetical protein
MDAAARSIVIATCLAALAVIGYFAIGEYNSKYSRSAQTKVLLEQNQETMKRLDSTLGQ